MTRKFFSFPSIGQFAGTIKHVASKTRYSGRDENDAPVYNTNPLPKIKYRGTVKMHGTNAGIVYNPVTQELGFQSRERVLTLEQDNAGFMLAMLGKKEKLQALMCQILNRINTSPVDRVVLFGEWCGGNIQKSVALNGLPKMFVIFGVKFIWNAEDETGETDEWMNLDLIKDLYLPEDGIFNILNFPTYEMEIDFENPHRVQNQIIELVNKVEAECPVALAFGSSGIGEGICWAPIEQKNDSGFWFKSKGELHQNSKVKTLSEVDVAAVESINAYVEMFVTENRLEQMLDVMVREKLLPFEMKSMGDFIRMVFNDCIKESQDEIVKNQLDVKKLGGPIANVARRWYINKFNSTDFTI